MSEMAKRLAVMAAAIVLILCSALTSAYAAQPVTLLTCTPSVSAGVDKNEVVCNGTLAATVDNSCSYPLSSLQGLLVGLNECRMRAGDVFGNWSDLSSDYAEFIMDGQGNFVGPGPVEAPTGIGVQ